MKPKKLPFDTENLVVHWLDISIEGLYESKVYILIYNYKLSLYTWACSSVD